MPKGPSRSARALTFIAAIAAASVTTGATARCWQPHELDAAEVRYFQSMLMVGALKCRDTNRFIEDDYNRFVTRSGGVLQDHNDVIRARFLRDYGPRMGEDRYDSFTTRLANDFSSISDFEDFCYEAAALARLSADAHPYDVVVLARAVVGSLPLIDPECGAGDGYASADAYRREEVAEAPRLPIPGPERRMHVLRPARVVAPAAETVAVDEHTVPAIAATDERDEAMSAALDALEAAAEALRAVNTPTEIADRAQQKPSDMVDVDGIPTDNRPLIPSTE